MDLMIVLLVGLAIFSLMNSTMRQRRQQGALARRQQLALESALVSSRAAAEEDVTRFGEELQRLDIDVAGQPLDEAMQQDYTRALDAYDAAKTSLAAVTRPEEIRNVTEILADGRYAISCVKARVAGEALPRKLPPCFFNPAHGPSVRNVQWAPQGGTPRDVPACGADAERVLAGADPNIRTVMVGSQRVPYWQGGSAYAPWAQGYYSGWQGNDLIRDVMLTSMIFNSMSMMPWMVAGMANGVGEWGGGLAEGIGDWGGGLADGIGEGFSELGHGLGELGGGISDGFGEIGDFFGGLFGD